MRYMILFFLSAAVALAQQVPSPVVKYTEVYTVTQVERLKETMVQRAAYYHLYECMFRHVTPETGKLFEQRKEEALAVVGMLEDMIPVRMPTEIRIVLIDPRTINCRK